MDNAAACGTKGTEFEYRSEHELWDVRTSNRRVPGGTKCASWFLLLSYFTHYKITTRH